MSFKVGDKVKIKTYNHNVEHKRNCAGIVDEIVRKSYFYDNAWVLKNSSGTLDYVYFNNELELFSDPRTIKFSEIKNGDRIHVNNNVEGEGNVKFTITVYKTEKAVYGEFGNVFSEVFIYSFFISDAATITLIDRKIEPFVAPEIGSRWAFKNGRKYTFEKGGIYRLYDWPDSEFRPTKVEVPFAENNRPFIEALVAI